MTDKTLTRREAAALAAGLAALATAGTAAASEKHPQLESARTALMEAKGHLEQAVKGDGGHRAKALEHTTAAIEEVQNAIAAAEA